MTNTSDSEKMLLAIVVVTGSDRISPISICNLIVLNKFDHLATVAQNMTKHNFRVFCKLC